jgi:hypothetical protein
MMKLRTLFPSLLLLCVFASPAAQAQSTNFAAIQEAATETATASQVGPHPASLASEKGINFLGSDAVRIARATELLRVAAARTPRTKESLKTVTLAVQDSATQAVGLLTLSKELFLTKGARELAQTSLGNAVEVAIMRANGVNTAVRVQDAATGRELIPLVVEYPIEKGGELRELAYYTSVHPALLSSATVEGGQLYVRTMLDRAAADLSADGVEISPAIIDIAEHLCVVEHTDHKRFLAEDRPALFREIYSLYALNTPDTFRYSVSSAGAGGMVQMIPQTYQMVRDRHPNVRLEADFVRGMTNHPNALAAMLLYMQDTWNDLQKKPEVQEALASGLATQAELVAAGYNSNPARLPQYLKRGGSLWRTLIPTETQMYLQIYASLDNSIAFKPRATRSPGALAAANHNNHARTVFGSSLSQLLPALGHQLWLSIPLISMGLR